MARLNADMNRALNEPGVRATIEQTTTMIIGGSAAELAATMKSDLEITAQLVKALGLEAE
jgi:tripartite-type tricarboxylate transporter receptor subunit TctC